MNQKTKNILYQLAAILILVSAVLYMFKPEIASLLMIVGVAGFAAITFISPYPGESIRGKRLFNMQIFSVLLMAASCYLMYIKMNEWPVPLILAAILLLYSSILIPKELEKEKKERKNRP